MMFIIKKFNIDLFSFQPCCKAMIESLDAHETARDQKKMTSDACTSDNCHGSMAHAQFLFV